MSEPARRPDRGPRALDAHANLHVQRAIDSEIAAGHEIGVQVAAYHHGALVIDCWGGYADPGAGRAVDGDTLFNVYSVTKAVAATAIHLLVERGQLDYDACITDWWPEYGAHGKGRTTLRDVLTHRAGIPQMPANVTTERMCDWEWMTRAIADLAPLAEPGTKTLYLSMTFGWILGELVRRADPRARSLGRFVREEIAAPLGIADLWIGLPSGHEPRVARQVNAMIDIPQASLPPLFAASMPAPCALVPAVFERPDVRHAEVAGVGGIFTARSEARFWAMLAQGGELDGVRLLSADRVASMAVPRARSEEPDAVMFGFPIPITQGGFWFGGSHPPVCSARHPGAICHPGQGGSIGWASPASRLAVAICHNRLFNPVTREDDAILRIADAVHQALGLE